MTPQEYKIDGCNLIISKNELITWQSHFGEQARARHPKEDTYRLDPMEMYYLGKHDVLTDLLKLFEKEE